MSYSTGFSPSGSLLGGLSTKPSVAAYGKGRAMSTAAGLGMKRQEADQAMASEQMQQDSRQRMQQAGNYASRSGNESQERMQQGGLDNRMANFNLGMRYQQRSDDRQRQLNFRQALFDSMTRDV